MTILHLFIVALVFFESGYGQDPCNWSRRIIPRGASGNFTVEVPVHYSYWSGYINWEPFGTYFWARGWCTYKESYFRCPYGNQNGIHTTTLTLPEVENISYVMLKDSYPITLHRSEDKTVPGFYVEEGNSLDFCSEYYTFTLRWRINGKAADLKDISCYQNGEKFCSGLSPDGTGDEQKCGFVETKDGLCIGYMFYKPTTRFGYYYCYLDKGMTKALTYIIDWKNATKTRDTSLIVKESSAHRDVPKPSTSSAPIILVETLMLWLWPFLASHL
ncbi:hypothetical protein SprV_0602079800 [Sparganum proliferum]